MIPGQVNSSNLFCGVTYTTYKVTGQMVFGCDILLTTPDVAVCEAIRRRNKKLMDRNENRKLQKYRVREKVLVRDKRKKNKIKPQNAQI